MALEPMDVKNITEVWPNREKVYVPEPWKGD